MIVAALVTPLGAEPSADKKPSADREPSEESKPAFQISTIHTGNIKGQTVLTAFLDNPVNASLVIVTVDESNQRNLGLYELRDGFYQAQPDIERPLASDVILMDVGRIQNREVLVMFTRSKAWQYDPYTGRRRELIGISSIYGTTIFGSIPKMDLFRDLNEDGLDDFIIPGFEGFQVFIQKDDGSFYDPVSVHAPPLVDMSYSDYPLYQPTMSFLSDFTLDGRKDLAFWVDGKFSVLRQQTNGNFSNRPMRVDSLVKFDYDGFDRMSTAMRDADQSNINAKALFQVSDLDGDGIPDLVTLSISSKGVFKKTTTYEFHKGIAGSDVVEFSPVPISRIESKGIQFDMKEQDFNNDGQMDMVISTVELGLGKVLAALITRSIGIDLNFYQMEDGKYSAKPDFKREITATFSLSSGDVFFPSVLLADVDGDKVTDLLVQDGSNKLKIYLGGKDGRLFAKRSVNIDVSMPNEPDLVELADLNSDGKMDIVMRHQAAGEPRKVVVMVSK